MVEPEEKQHEEDDFMPTTQEVAETLAGMRSRSDNRDRGHEVSRKQIVLLPYSQYLTAGAIYPDETCERNTRSDTALFSFRLGISTDLPSQFSVVFLPSLLSQLGRKK